MIVKSHLFEKGVEVIILSKDPNFSTFMEDICLFPVVTVKAGHVYDHRAVENLLQNNGGTSPHAKMIL